MFWFLFYDFLSIAKMEKKHFSHWEPNLIIKQATGLWNTMLKNKIKQDMNKFFLKGTVMEDELVHTEEVTSVK